MSQINPQLMALYNLLGPGAQQQPVPQAPAAVNVNSLTGAVTGQPLPAQQQIPPVAAPANSMALLAQALAGIPQPQPKGPLANDPTVEARVPNYAHGQGNDVQVRSPRPQHVMSMGRGARGGMMGPSIRESIPKSERQDAADMRNGTGEYGPNAGIESGGNTETRSPVAGTTPQRWQQLAKQLGTSPTVGMDGKPVQGWENTPAGQQAIIEDMKNAGRSDYREDETQSQPSGLLARLAAQHNAPKTGPWTIEEDRGIPGQPGSTQNNRTFDANGNITDQPVTPALKLIADSGLKPDQQKAIADYASTPGVTPEQIHSAINEVQNRNAIADRANNGMTKWKETNKALLAERNTAYQQLKSASAARDKARDSLLYDPASPDAQNLEKSIDAARQKYETADQKYTNSVNAIPGNEQNQNSSVPPDKQQWQNDLDSGNTQVVPTGAATQPVAGSSSGSAAPIGVFQRLLLQRSAQPIVPGMRFNHGQLVRSPKGGVHRVIGAAPDGSPLFSPDLLSNGANA
jgi:hypothetical protein